MLGLAVGIGIASSGLSKLEITLVLIALTAFAFWMIHLTEIVWNTHDDQRIVVDEIAGQAIAIAYVQPSLVISLIAFALFRLFDIWKPGPIGWIDRAWPGASGTLFDDILAGICAAILVYGLATSDVFQKAVGGL